MRTPAPALTKTLSVESPIISILFKFFRLIKTPLNPLSETRMFVPPPINEDGILFLLKKIKASFKWSSFLGQKKASTGPPILYAVRGFRGLSNSIVPS